MQKSKAQNHVIVKQLHEIREPVKHQNLQSMQEPTVGKIDSNHIDVNSLRYFPQQNADGVILSILDAIHLAERVSYELGAGHNGDRTGLYLYFAIKSQHLLNKTKS